VNDDESGKIIRSDLSQEVPTDRAVYRYQAETVKFKGHTGWLGRADFELDASSLPGSSQSAALTTLYLAATAVLITGVASGIGIPAMTALITGLGATAGYYLLVHLTRGRQNRRLGRR
jgi:hypothetical protein